MPYAYAYAYAYANLGPNIHWQKNALTEAAEKTENAAMLYNTL
jgi:hypothetical protein